MADELAAAAELVMGKASGVPVAVVRGVDPAWLREGSVRPRSSAPRRGPLPLSRSLVASPRVQLARRGGTSRRTGAMPSSSVVHGFQPRWMPARPGSRADRASSPARAGRVARPARSTPAAVGHGGVELVDRRLHAGADVDQQPAAPRRRPGRRRRPRRRRRRSRGSGSPSPKIVHGSPGQQAAGEDGHHARLAVRVLAGPVDVGQRQRGELEVVQLAVGGQVVARRLLGHAVGRQRPLRVRLLDGQVVGSGVAVERAAAGREHDLARARRPGRPRAR